MHFSSSVMAAKEGAGERGKGLSTTTKTTSKPVPIDRSSSSPDRSARVSHSCCVLIFMCSLAGCTNMHVNTVNLLFHCPGNTTSSTGALFFPFFFCCFQQSDHIVRCCVGTQTKHLFFFFFLSHSTSALPSGLNCTGRIKNTHTHTHGVREI